MISCAKGVPISSPVFMQRSNLSMNSLWMPGVAWRFAVALSGTVSRHCTLGVDSYYAA